MNKSIELKEKALCIIDYLTESYAGRHHYSDEDIRDMLAQIYMISHAAADTECEHPDWVENLEQLYQTMKEKNIL